MKSRTLDEWMARERLRRGGPRSDLAKPEIAECVRDFARRKAKGQTQHSVAQFADMLREKLGSTASTGTVQRWVRRAQAQHLAAESARAGRGSKQARGRNER